MNAKAKTNSNTHTRTLPQLTGRMVPEFGCLAVFAAQVAAGVINRTRPAALPSCSTPITYNNRDSQKNLRDLTLGHLVGVVIYMLIGIIGGLGILGRAKVPNPRTICDYFNPHGWVPALIQLVYFIHLSTVMPIWNFVSRNQFFSVVFKGKPEPNWVYHTFNVVICVVCTLIQILNINVNIVINLNSTLIASFFVYVVPFCLRLSEFK